jgi:hypothetical protein
LRITKNSKGENLNFSQCKLEGALVGEFRNIVFENCDKMSIGIGDKIENVLVQNCNNTIRFIMGGIGENIIINNCKDVFLKLSSCQVNDLNISMCDILTIHTYESKLIKRNQISKSNLYCFVLQKLLVEDLLVKESTIDGETTLRDVSFSGLKLENIKYLDEYKLDAKNVRYKNSDRFPEK